MRARLDAVRTHVALAVRLHDTRGLEHGTGGCALRPLGTPKVPTLILAVRPVGPQSQGRGHGVVTRESAQEAEVGAEGATLEEEAGEDGAGQEGQQQIARPPWRLHDTENVVSPRDQYEQGVNDPDAVPLEEARHGKPYSRDSLDEVAHHREGARRAPEACEEEVRQREQRPPKDPDDGGARVVVHARGAEESVEHDHREHDHACRLKHTRIPAAAKQRPEARQVQQIGLLAGRGEEVKRHDRRAVLLRFGHLDCGRGKGGIRHRTPPRSRASPEPSAGAGAA